MNIAAAELLPDDDLFGLQVPYDRDREIGLLRDYYDPIRIHHSLPTDMLLQVVSQHKDAIEVPGLGTIEGPEVVLAEATDLGLIEEPDDIFGLAANTQHQIIEARHKYAGEIALATTVVVGQAKEARHKRDELLRAQGAGSVPELPSDLVLAAKFLTMVAHEKRTRRQESGYYKKHYFGHSDTVATVLRLAWDAMLGPSHKPLLKDLVTTGGYGHDDPEETMLNDGAYLAKNVAVTPLVIRRTIEAQNVLAPNQLWAARDIGMSSLLFMRSHGVYGPSFTDMKDQMDYLDYIRRGVYYPGLAGLTMELAKGGDIEHNDRLDAETLIEFTPGTEKIFDRKMRYKRGREINAEALGHMHPEFVLTLAKMMHISQHEVTRAQRRKFQFDLSDIPAFIRDEVAKMRAND